MIPGAWCIADRFENDNAFSRSRSFRACERLAILLEQPDFLVAQIFGGPAFTDVIF